LISTYFGFFKLLVHLAVDQSPRAAAKVKEVIMSSVKVGGYKFDIPKFDGRSDYVLWERQVKGALKASGLCKVLRPKPEKVNEED
jgi:hypothetical protein